MQIKNDLIVNRKCKKENSLIDNYLYQKTGQQISKFTNDDGDLKLGNGNVDLSKLNQFNPFGTTDRFTGIDKNYPQDFNSNIIIDWRSFDGTNVWGWFKEWLPERRLDLHLRDAPYTRNGFNDWNIANYNQLQSIFKPGQLYGIKPQGFYYPPFNWHVLPKKYNEAINGLNSRNPRLHIATFLSGNKYWLYSGVFNYSNYWNYSYACLIRKFSLIELGL